MRESSSRSGRFLACGAVVIGGVTVRAAEDETGHGRQLVRQSTRALRAVAACGSRQARPTPQ